MMMHVIEFVALIGGFILMMMYWCVRNMRRAAYVVTDTRAVNYVLNMGEDMKNKCDANAQAYMMRRAEKKLMKATANNKPIV